MASSANSRGDDAPRIAILPDDVVNKIAAGEVVERPAAAVKELVENAVDSGATRIRVRIESGGRRLIEVTDNGRGMDRDDLLLCIERHATSKVRHESDLWTVASLGFRGEALASLAEISRMEIHSATHGAAHGARLLVDGGVRQGIEEAAPIGGTRLTVRNLFFNTPAIRKFLRTPETEQTHVVEAVSRLALAHPEVDFRVRTEKKEVLTAATARDLHQRAEAVLGRKTAKALHPFEWPGTEISARGLLSDASISRGSARGSYFFVNGRFVRDRTLSAAVREAYADVIPRGRYPVVVLFLELASGTVDVNVHPTKMEVRFADAQSVYRFVRSRLRAEVGPDLGGFALTPDRAPSSPGGGQSPLFGSAAGGRTVGEPRRSWGSPSTYQEGNKPFEPVGRASSRFFEETEGGLDGPGASPSNTKVPERAMGLVAGRWLLCEVHDGLLVVDAREGAQRLCFQRIVVGAGGEGSQLLLVPQLVDLTAPEMVLAVKHRSVLASVGLEVDDFGGGSLAVKALPGELPAVLAAAAVRDCLSALEKGVVDRSRLAWALAAHAPVPREDLAGFLLRVRALPGQAPQWSQRTLFHDKSAADLERWFGA